MKKIRQFTALIIAFAVVACSGIFSVSVLANEVVVTDESSATIEITEADKLLVEKLEAFGIVKDIKADLTAKLTRREMAEIITDYMRIPKASADFETSPFIDVPVSDRSMGSIMALYNMKIITGDNTMRFHPDAYLNYDEALVFVVNAIGYKFFATRDGGYPTGYHRIAIKLGMLEDLAMQSGKDEITRLDAYKLLEAGLRSAAVTYGVYTDEEVQYTFSTTEDFLSDTYGITTHKGIITGTEDTHLTNPSSRLTDEQIEIDYTLYDTPGYVYASSLGRSVVYYLRSDGSDGKEIAYIEENDELNSVVKIDAKDIVPGRTTDTRVYYTDNENKEYHVDFIDGVDVIYNGRAYRGYLNISNVLPTTGYIEALDNNGDEVADVLFVYEYRNVLVSAIDAYKNEIIPSVGSRIPCDVEGGNARIYIAPEMTKGTIKNVTVNSVASVLESKGTPKLTTVYVSTGKVEGTISEVLSDGTVIIDGEKYKKSASYINSGVALVAGATVSLSMDYDGYIAYAENVMSDGGKSELGVLAGMEYEISALGNKFQLRLYTQKGEFRIVELSSPIRINGAFYDMTKSTAIENALKLLSNNQQENGKYTITEAKIVSYVLNGDVVSSIDTGASRNPSNLQVINNVVDHITVRPTPQIIEMHNRNDDGSAAASDYAIYNKNEIVVFTAPYNNPNTSENEVLGNNGYSVGHKLEERDYRKLSNNYTTYTENTALYSLSNNDDVYRIDALLFRGSALAGGTSDGSRFPSDSSAFYMITKVTSSVDSDGMPCKKIYFAGSSSKLTEDTIKMTDIDGYHGAVPITNSKFTALRPGYVIQYGLSSAGKIDRIRVISSVDVSGAVERHYNYLDYTQGIKCATGRISQNSPSSGTIGISEYRSTNKYFGIVGSTKIYVYYSADNKVVEASQSELMVGDWISAHIKNYHTLSEIFIIR